jgi:hypothetical protein
MSDDKTFEEAQKEREEDPGIKALNEAIELTKRVGRIVAAYWIELAAVGILPDANERMCNEYMKEVMVRVRA